MTSQDCGGTGSGHLPHSRLEIWDAGLPPDKSGCRLGPAYTQGVNASTLEELRVGKTGLVGQAYLG